MRDLLWPIGAALATAALIEIVPRVNRWRAPLVGSLVVAVAAWVLWPIPLGQMPISQDHPVHLFRAWHFFTQSLAHGRLDGWSDYWFAGWPAGQDYPPGGDWWMALFRALTFAADWETTYAIGFFSMFAFAGLAVFCFARRFGLLAAFLAAAFFLLDRGEYREGGFQYAVYWGVWPQQLSTALVLLGLHALLRQTAKSFAVAVLLMGAALLCHPIALIMLACALVALSLSRGAQGLVIASRSTVVLLLAWGVASVFLVPFGSRAEIMATYGDPWKPLGAVALGLARGDLFAHVPPPLAWLAMVGFVFACWRRNSDALFLGLWAGFLITISSSSITDSLAAVSPKIGQVQWQRVAACAKPAMFLLAAWMLSQALEWLHRQAHHLASRRISPPMRSLLQAACLATIFVGARPAWAAWQREYAPLAPRTHASNSLQRAYEQFLDWSAQERAASRDFYRIAYAAPYNDHFFSAAPIWNHTPAYKLGFTPASNFIHKPDQGTSELYRALSVRYVVSRRQITDSDLILARRFGPIHVYEFSQYQPKRFTLTGNGTAEAKSFDSDRIQLRFVGTDAHSRIVLHVADHPRWQATLDGHPTPILTTTLADEPIFMSVSAAGSQLVLRYVRRGEDWVGSGMSLLSLGLVILLFTGRPPLRALDRSGIAVILGLVVILGARHVFAMRSPVWSLLGSVAQASVDLETAGPCRWESNRFRCTPASWGYVGVTQQRIAGIRRECVWAHPIAGDRLRIRTPTLPPHRKLVLHYGLLDTSVDGFRSGAPVKLTVNGRVIVAPNRKGWRKAILPAASDVEIAIEADRVGGRHFCLNVEALP